MQAQDQAEQAATANQALQSSLVSSELFPVSILASETLVPQAEAQARVSELQAATQNSGMQLSRIPELEEQIRQMEARHQQMRQEQQMQQQGATELKR